MKITDGAWETAQKGEAKWWDKGTNTIIEDLKQLSHVKRLGLKLDQAASLWVNCKEKSVIDIGGGITSLLLKAYNFKRAVVIDPIPMPKWVELRYEAAGIEVIHDKAENLLAHFEEGEKPFDEAWIYNCLQHVQDPKLIVESTRKIAKLIRIQEWIDVHGDEMHPQTLTEADLNEWLKGKGSVGILNERWLAGKAYFGVFQTQEGNDGAIPTTN